MKNKDHFKGNKKNSTVAFYERVGHPDPIVSLSSHFYFFTIAWTLLIFFLIIQDISESHRASRHMTALKEKTAGLTNFDETVIGGNEAVFRLFDDYLSAEKSSIHKHAGAFILLWISGLAVMGFMTRRLNRQAAEKAATERSRQPEKKFGLIVEDLPIGIYIVTNGIISFVNRQASRIYGYTREEMIGMDSAMLVHPEERALVRDLRKRRLAGEKIPEYQIRGIGKDGRIIQVKRKHTVIDEDGEKSIVAAIEDVTELAKAKAFLERSTEELENRNRELDSFAGTASHDLKEPLRKIRLFGDLLLSENKQSLNEAGVGYLRRIQNAAERMNALIESLLDYSRSGTESEPFQLVNLRETVAEALINLEVLVDTSDARISIGALPVVKADRVQMVQLFQNLISNALKFQDGSREPTIKISGAGICHGTSGDQVEIRVEDNGIGFDTDFSDSIFLPFKRIQTGHEGSGIGLAICRKIVEHHRGKISASSRPGEGTTITVVLPAWNKP